MGHPFNKFRQNKVEQQRVAGLVKGYKHGGRVEGEKARHRADRPRASGGSVQDSSQQDMKGSGAGDSQMGRLNRARGGRNKKAATVVNVITGGGFLLMRRPP